MAHSKTYTRLLNSRQWRETRERKLNDQPLCERCKRDGYITAATCVHHITPVESGRTDKECAELCFSFTNLMSLCYRCHADIHMAEGKGTKENHKQREQERLQQWIDRNNKKSGGQ